MEKKSRLHSAARLSIALSFFLGVSAPAQSATQAVEFSKAVSIWYVPLEKESHFRKYEIDITQTKDLTTNEVLTSVTVVRVKCRKDVVGEGQVAFYCGRGPNQRKPPRELTTEVAEFEMADDMSSATAKFKMHGQTHVVHFEEPADTSGVFDRRGTCGTSGVQLVAGTFENMHRAYGRVLGQRVATQSVDSYDHAWLEHAYGAWC